jgi:hypothetical protein
MTNKRRVLIIILFSACLAALSLSGLNAAGAQYSAIIAPRSSRLSVSVEYNDGALNVSVLGGSAGYMYQYWIKTKVIADSSSDITQYIWQIYGAGFVSQSAVTIPVTKNEVDEAGKYNVIVRVKDSAEGSYIVDELYGAFSLAAVGQPEINSIEIFGKIYDGSDIIIDKDKANGFEGSIKINANIGSLGFKIYYGDSHEAAAISGESEIDFDFSRYAPGRHKFRVEAECGENVAAQYFTVYIYRQYCVEDNVIIDGLTGNTDKTTGNTQFVMLLKYADGRDFEDGDGDLFQYSLISGRLAGEVAGKAINGDTLAVTFSVNYACCGIYTTTAEVFKAGALCDKIIVYYDGYSRGRDLNMSLPNGSAIPVGQKVTIEADGGIYASFEKNGTVPACDLRYAFYREDASGWVKIKDYGDNVLEWTPQRPGTYKIQARVKDIAAVNYEKETTYSYTVEGTNFDGNIELSILNYEDDTPAQEITAGKPYKLSVAYFGRCDKDCLLYKFTLYTGNLGTVYLSDYSPSSCAIFIPARVDTYTVTARVIDSLSYGYKDDTSDISVTSVIPSRTVSVYGFIDFEQPSHEALIYNDADHTPDNRETAISRVSYDGAGISPAEDGGLYCSKVTPAHKSADYAIFFIDAGKPVIMGTTVRFKFYFQKLTAGGGSYKVMLNNNWEATARISVYDTWFDVEYTFDTMPENFYAPNSVMVRVRLYDYTDARQLNFYIDNAEVTVPAVWPGKGPVGFETAGQEYFVYNYEIYTPPDRQVSVSRAAYAEEGVPYPDGGGMYAVKVTPGSSKAQSYVQFYIDTGRPVSPGTTIAFKFYIKTELTGTYAVSFNNSQDATPPQSITNQWIDVAYTYTQLPENFQTPNSVQVRIRFISGFAVPTQLTMYIDNIIVTD